MAIANDYPRPMLRRAEWTSLDGVWDFALDPEARWRHPDQVTWDRQITVPFSPETPASGIDDPGFFYACWYRRTFIPPSLPSGERLILHFGAVDYAATVWVNDAYAGHHEGGYTPLALDITDLVSTPGELRVVVRAEDDPLDLAKPRGKQDWQLKPHAIWYPRTTGIWQTVWLERLPATWIDTLRWSSSLESWEITIEALVDGARRDDLRLRLRLTVGSGKTPKLLVDDTYAVVAGEVHRRIALSDPGIDDFRNELLWSPSSPTLIQAQLRLEGPEGELVDEVFSYTALRAVGIQGDRFILNGRPYSLRMVLDQGYWPESGMTAPTPDALRRDVELAKKMGFNGVRKHQKLEDPRYLYWADTLGLLVWEEMPSAYRFTKRSVDRLTREWKEALNRDSSHPCIITWVPFNESWGVPDLPNNPAQRDYVQALYHLTKTFDSSRPVIGNDGWESVATDIIGIHDYDEDAKRLEARYGTVESIPNIFHRERPGGRLLALDGHPHTGQPLMLSEFGGIAYVPPERRDPSWGYARAETPADLQRQYTALLTAVRGLSLLAGFCYTQFTDTYQETNGLLYADRTPKFPLAQIARATRGPTTQQQQEMERRARTEAAARRASRPRRVHRRRDAEPTSRVS